MTVAIRIPLPAVALLLWLALSAEAQAQVAPSAPPREFDRRESGGSNAPGGIEVGPGDISGGTGARAPQDRTIVRTTTVISLTEDRQWTNAEGRVIVARVIAWQDSTEEHVRPGRPGDPPAQNPAAEEVEIPDDFVPEVVRDNKVRLLRGQQAYELALDQLSEDDREFVKQLDEAVQATAARRQAAKEAAMNAAAEEQEKTQNPQSNADQPAPEKQEADPDRKP